MPPDQEVRVSSRDEAQKEQCIRAIDDLARRAWKEDDGLSDAALQFRHHPFGHMFRHQAPTDKHVRGVAGVDATNKIEPRPSRGGIFRVHENGQAWASFSVS